VVVSRQTGLPYVVITTYIVAIVGNEVLSAQFPETKAAIEGVEDAPNWVHVLAIAFVLFVIAFGASVGYHAYKDGFGRWSQ
jgi:hypothetical protein